jgi:hypothetical protein
MQFLYSFIALDLANERSNDVFSLEFRNHWDANAARYAADQAAAATGRPSYTRRALAHGFAAVSRSTAAAVRRLDHVVADDLGRELAPSK